LFGCDRSADTSTMDVLTCRLGQLFEKFGKSSQANPSFEDDDDELERLREAGYFDFTPSRHELNSGAKEENDVEDETYIKVDNVRCSEF